MGAPPPLPAALSGERRVLDGRAGPLSYYTAAPETDAGAPPLLLVHSINAAASAHEVRPLYEHYRRRRPVYAPDLPGYGFSERSERLYTPRLMTDAVHDMIDEIRRRRGDAALDGLAVSLSCEYLARAAVERPRAFRSPALVSPTGFNRSAPLHGPPESTRGRPWLRRLFGLPGFGRALFYLLTSPPSVRFFLEKTWGSKRIDETMFEFCCRTTRQPGARHAPFCFLSGYLFSADITRVYESLDRPVWVSHGVRGDFTDYRWKQEIEPRPNWHVQVFQTGALPYFEVPDEFLAGYEVFLSGGRRPAQGT